MKSSKTGGSQPRRGGLPLHWAPPLLQFQHKDDAQWFQTTKNPPKICSLLCYFTNFSKEISTWIPFRFRRLYAFYILNLSKALQAQVWSVNFTNFLKFSFWRVFCYLAQQCDNYILRFSPVRRREGRKYTNCSSRKILPKLYYKFTQLWCLVCSSKRSIYLPMENYGLQTCIFLFCYTFFLFPFPFLCELRIGNLVSRLPSFCLNC